MAELKKMSALRMLAEKLKRASDPRGTKAYDKDPGMQNTFGSARKTKAGKKYIAKNSPKAGSVVPRDSDPRGTNFWDKKYGKTHNPNGTKKK
tara:strand:+ start:213 stop:488 length:276 start_codon:yes stop_codon:yes gene_type:complete